MISKIRKNLIALILVSFVIYFALTFYANFNTVLNTFRTFPLLLLPLLLGLSFVNYFSRFLKWHYYLRSLKIQIGYGKSFHIFFSGLLMSVTPGKFGELLKAYLVKYETGEAVSKVMPVTIVERITDFYSLLLLAIIGAYIYNIGKVIIIVTLLFFIALTIVVINKKFAFGIIQLLNKIPFLEKFINHIRQAYESAYILLQPKRLFAMTALSLVSWGVECVGFYLVLINFGLKVSLFWSIFIYAFATIAGSITLLPAGIGITEGSLTYFIFQASGSMSKAVASTMVTRVVTLWFAILLGIISLYLYYAKNPNLIEELSNIQKSQ